MNGNEVGETAVAKGMFSLELQHDSHLVFKKMQ